MERSTQSGHGTLLQTLLSDNLKKDSYRCAPPAARVFAAPKSSAPMRSLHGDMPHYSVFRGGYRYRMRSEETASGKHRWLVELRVALKPSEAEQMVLPDCHLKAAEARCHGVPNEDAPGRDACPTAGRFTAPATAQNVGRLLKDWSTRIEADFNRDAQAYGIPVRYDFTFFLANDPLPEKGPIDWRLPLQLNCSRQPYFRGLRSGWSQAVLSHEIGHFLGLLDEYYALSGISSLFPKTPFNGAETSRMGLSMKRHTRFLPLHHYLILRRYHCLEPAKRDPFAVTAPI